MSYNSSCNAGHAYRTDRAHSIYPVQSTVEVEILRGICLGRVLQDEPTS